MDLKITPSGQTIVKPTALGPGANTDTKLLIYGLFQKGRVLAQDAYCQPSLDTSHPKRPGAPILSSFVFLDTTGVTRDALEGLNWPHFRHSSLIPIFECHVCAQ